MGGLVFVILCFLVDITMLARLRWPVNESINRINPMDGSNEKHFEKKKSELEDTFGCYFPLFLVLHIW